MGKVKRDVTDSARRIGRGILSPAMFWALVAIQLVAISVHAVCVTIPWTHSIRASFQTFGLVLPCILYAFLTDQKIRNTRTARCLLWPLPLLILAEITLSWLGTSIPPWASALLACLLIPFGIVLIGLDTCSIPPNLRSAKLSVKHLFFATAATAASFAFAKPCSEFGTWAFLTGCLAAGTLMSLCILAAMRLAQEIDGILARYRKWLLCGMAVSMFALLTTGNVIVASHAFRTAGGWLFVGTDKATVQVIVTNLATRKRSLVFDLKGENQGRYVAAWDGDPSKDDVKVFYLPLGNYEVSTAGPSSHRYTPEPQVVTVSRTVSPQVRIVPK